jgi:glutathione synthase/RimK-type ligase-like ATP-grasp enzyme
MSGPTIGFLTARFLGGLYGDDRLAAEALERRGATVTPVDWRQPIDPGLDAVVVRSPWDWFHHRAEFRAFLAGLSEQPFRTFNPPSILQRFADKTYFRHLESLGVDVVPTVFFPAAGLSEAAISEVLARRDWTSAVLKPSFTANAQGAVRVRADEDLSRVVDQTRAAPIDSEWMLQPFVPSIETEGEWSLVFFGGQFSHAVRKQPRLGDYRVQADHGGTSMAAEAPAHVLNAAVRAVATAARDTLYARVDGVIWDDRFCVMELELVEPELFFRLEPLAAERFGDALLAAL